MSPNPPIQHTSQPTDHEETLPLESGKAIRADAFDRFIEEQLQREVAEGNNSESDVVCHAY